MEEVSGWRGCQGGGVSGCHFEKKKYVLGKMDKMGCQCDGVSGFRGCRGKWGVRVEEVLGWSGMSGWKGCQGGGGVTWINKCLKSSIKLFIAWINKYFNQSIKLFITWINK